jgi:hypothetical protein
MSDDPRNIRGSCEPSGALVQASRLKFVAWWALISLIAIGVCSLKWPYAHFSDEYVPVGNDAFYHGRRILDTVADPSAFYQFDPKIHAPEGSLLNWPWGYDYLMAMLVKLAGILGVPGPPIAILMWLPVVAVLLPIGLIMLIARRLGLSEPLVIVAGVVTAVLPLTQYLYGVGEFDHHFAEHIFVLATLASGLKWFSRPQDSAAAIVLGVVLGAAPAIHNALFILQVPVLASLFALWAQGTRMPMRATLQFAAALVLTTLAVLIPSLPFQLGLFEFYTLSWFHLYVAACTAAVAIILACLAPSARNIALLAAIALVLVLPLGQQILVARAFLGGKIVRLDAIVEARPLLLMASSAGGRQELTMSYSALLWTLPFAGAYCAWLAWQERATPRVFFWICSVLGLALLLSQMRMHYFGSFALYLPWLYLAQAGMARWPDKHKLITLGVALTCLLAFWMPGRYQLAGAASFAGDPAFRGLRPILEDLKRACAQDPGIVLADNDAGHYIRYYTDCSVIANNFLLTRQHEQKIEQVDYLFSVPAAAFPGVAPFVRYILVRPVSIMRERGKTRYMSYGKRDAELVKDLLLKPLEQIPSNYVLIEQANMHAQDENRSVPYIRLFKVNPVAERSAPTGSSASSLKHVGK